MRKIVGMSGFVIIVILGGAMFHFNQRPIPGITVQKTLERMEKDTNLVLLDVRTVEEWNSETGRLEGALLIPVQELDARVEELEPYKDKTIIAYCRSGNRSGRATEYLTAKGFTVLNMEGGMIRWNTENLPVVLEKKE